MQTFTLYRTAIEPGVTPGKESVAYNRPEDPTLEGVIFSDGRVGVRWLTSARSTVLWDCWDDFFAIHIGTHPDYGTLIVWGDGTEERR